MRFAPRLAIPVTLFTLAVAGCGGATVTVSEVPGQPAELGVPGTGAALAPQASATPTATPTATAEADTAQATPVPEGTTADPATETAPEGTTEGGTAAPDDSATTDQPPPAGSDAQQFEDFCAENPGAC
jgi:hypothetical protein